MPPTKQDRPALTGVTLKVGESIDIIFEQGIVEIAFKASASPEGVARDRLTVQKVTTPDGVSSLSMRFGPVH